MWRNWNPCFIAGGNVNCILMCIPKCTCCGKWYDLWKNFKLLYGPAILLLGIYQKAMATQSSTLAWKMPWTEEPSRLQSMGSRLSDFTFTFLFHALEGETATHSSILAWRIPGTEEPSGLPSVGSHRVGHDWSNLAVAV